ncbi:hypothetical protein CFP56_039963 [Quercus suber]|uniref:Uncharacterized protein n=1 Tax=Quercus suber TaxID=58331 RepID=A0AAW0IZZ3_QUESU
MERCLHPWRRRSSFHHPQTKLKR